MIRYQWCFIKHNDEWQSWVLYLHSLQMICSEAINLLYYSKRTCTCKATFPFNRNMSDKTLWLVLKTKFSHIQVYWCKMTLPLGTRIACICECFKFLYRLYFVNGTKAPTYLQTLHDSPWCYEDVFKNRTITLCHCAFCCFVFFIPRLIFPRRVLHRGKHVGFESLAGGPPKSNVFACYPTPSRTGLVIPVNKVWGEHVTKSMSDREGECIRSRWTPVPGIAACSLAGKQEVVLNDCFLFLSFESVHVHVGLVRTPCRVSGDHLSASVYTLKY